GCVADGGALVLAADLLQPLGLVVGQPFGIGAVDQPVIAPAPPVAPQHAKPETRKSDACQAHPAQELTLGDASIGVGVRRIDDERLPVVSPVAHCIPRQRILGPGPVLSAYAFKTRGSYRVTPPRGCPGRMKRYPLGAAIYNPRQKALRSRIILTRTL